MKSLLISSLVFAVLFSASVSQAQQQPETTAIQLRAGVIKDLKAKLDDPDLDEAERYKVEAQIASVYITIGDYKNAIRHFESSMELQEQPSVEQYYGMARLYFQTEEIDKATTVLKEAEKIYPDSLDITELLASAFQRQEMWSESITRFEKFVELNKAVSNRPLPALFYFSYGVAVERGSNDVDRAAKLFKQALVSIKPANPGDREAVDQTRLFTAQVLNYLGYMQLENDINIDAAGESIMQAAKLDPDSGAIADSLGWFYFKKQRYMEAMSELLRAESHFDEDDMDGVILDHIAQTFQKIGNNEKAVEYIKRAVTKDPKNKEFANRLKQYESGSE